MADAPPEPTQTQKHRGTRPTTSEAAVLADATHVITVARSHLTEFVAADEGQSVKRVTGDTLDRMDQLVESVRTARGAQPVKRTGLLASTTAEIQARSSLFTLLTKARQRITTGQRDDHERV